MILIREQDKILCKKDYKKYLFKKIFEKGKRYLVDKIDYDEGIIFIKSSVSIIPFTQEQLKEYFKFLHFDKKQKKMKS